MRINRNEKKFSYMDENGDLVILNATLNEDNYLNLEKLNNELYTPRMEGSYSSSSEFGEEHSAHGLKECFASMLESNVLSMEGLYNLFDTDEQRVNPALVSRIQEFMSMFTFQKDRTYSKKVFDTMIRVNASSRLEKSPVFEEEVAMARYNTLMMGLTGVMPTITANQKEIQRIFR